MADNKLISIVGLVNQSSLTMFWDKAKAPISFTFPVGCVTDLELRKPEVLASAFREFLEQTKLPPSQIYLIISADQVFESEFPAKDSESAHVEIESFLKSVPFEHVANRVFSWGKGCKVAAINREIFECLQSVLESFENVVLAVTPANVLMEFLKSGFNVGSARQLLKKVDIIRQNSFIYQEETKEEELQKGSDPRKNKKLLTMLIVFGLLLAFLGVMVFKMMQENSKPPARIPPAASAIPQNMPAAQIVPPTPAASESAQNLKGLKVQILNATGTSGLAANTKRQLATLGLENIETSNSSTLVSTKQIVGFGPLVSEATKQILTTDISKILGDLSVQQLSTSTFDVVITLTKNSDATSSSQTAP